MTAFIAANLSCAAFNIAVTIGIWVAMFAGATPPADFMSFVVCLVLINLAIWFGVFAYVTAKRPRLI